MQGFSAGLPVLATSADRHADDGRPRACSYSFRTVFRASDTECSVGWGYDQVVASLLSSSVCLCLCGWLHHLPSGLAKRLAAATRRWEICHTPLSPTILKASLPGDPGDPALRRDTCARGMSCGYPGPTSPTPSQHTPRAPSSWRRVDVRSPRALRGSRGPE